MPNYVFNPPYRLERPTGTHRVFTFFDVKRGETVTRTGSTYRVGEWFNQDDLQLVDEYWLGGHQHVVDEATREGLLNGGVGITVANFTEI